MADFDIHTFDSFREGNRLEAKKAEGGLPGSLWETYSSFANSNGGAILLGVCERPDGSFYATGLKNADKLKKAFWDMVNNKTKVSAKVVTEDDVETFELPGGVIMAIRVPAAKREDRPVYINNDIWGGTFRRNHEGDYHCSASEVRAMIRDQGDETMDMLVLEDFALSDLCPETIKGYRSYHASVNPGHVWESLPDEQYLERIGAAGLGRDGVLHPTGAGLLMFGEEHRITRHFNEYFLDYRENMDPSIRWTDRVQSQSGDWSGNVFDFFFRVFSKATRDFPKPFKLEGINRVDDTPLHQAFREALANCFANADFYLPRGLVIIKEPNRIVLQNPGSIRTGLSQMIKGGVSDPRNKGIMKMWNLLKIGERAGSGVPDIYATWRNSGLGAPCVEESFGPDRTTMILPLTKIGLNEANPEANEANPEANSPLWVRIVEELRANPKATQIGLATKLGVSRATVQRAMNTLAKEGRIKRQGGTRGKWVVNE